MGSGTYIRSLARDLGEALGSTGFVTELQRIQVGEFNLIDPVTISKDNWTWEVIKQYLSLEPENLHHAQRNRQSRLSRNVFLTNNAKDKPIF